MLEHVGDVLGGGAVIAALGKDLGRGLDDLAGAPMGRFACARLGHRRLLALSARARGLARPARGRACSRDGRPI